MSAETTPGAARTRLGAGLTLLGVFALGVLAGLGVAPLLGPPAPPEGPDRIDRLARELELSAEQERRAEAIVERHRGDIEEAMASARPRLQEIHAEVERELREIMTPEQQREFEALRASRPQMPGM